MITANKTEKLIVYLLFSLIKYCVIIDCVFWNHQIEYIIVLVVRSPDICLDKYILNELLVVLI